MHSFSPPFSHLFFPLLGRRKGSGEHLPLPTWGLLQQSQVDLRGHDTDTWSLCLSFKKRKPAEELPQPLAPSIFFFLQRLSFTLFWSWL